MVVLRCLKNKAALNSKSVSVVWTCWTNQSPLFSGPSARSKAMSSEQQHGLLDSITGSNVEGKEPHMPHTHSVKCMPYWLFSRIHLQKEWEVNAMRHAHIYNIYIFRYIFIYILIQGFIPKPRRNWQVRYRQRKPSSILSKRFQPLAYSTYLLFYIYMAFSSLKQHMEEVTHMSAPSLLQRCCRAMEGHVDSFVLEPTAGSYPEVVPWSIQFRNVSGRHGPKFQCQSVDWIIWNTWTCWDTPGHKLVWYLALRTTAMSALANRCASCMSVNWCAFFHW